jgi:hypothetical protein
MRPTASLPHVLTSTARNRHLGLLASPGADHREEQYRRSRPDPSGKHPQKERTSDNLPEDNRHSLQQQKRHKDRRQSHLPPRTIRLRFELLNLC